LVHLHEFEASVGFLVFEHAHHKEVHHQYGHSEQTHGGNQVDQQRLGLCKGERERETEREEEREGGRGT